jgi:hypothetical protein
MRRKSRVNKIDETSAQDLYDLFIKSLLTEYKKTELYEAVLEKILPEWADTDSIQLVTGDPHDPLGIFAINRRPEMVDRSLTFLLAYEGNHEDALEFLLAHFPNQLGEAIKGYAASGNHIKVQSLLAQNARFPLIYSAMGGYAESYRILELAKLVTESISVDHTIKPECTIVLIPGFLENYIQYQGKYLLIKTDTNFSEFYYVNSQGGLEAIQIRDLRKFEQNFTNYWETSELRGSKNSLTLTRQTTQDLIISGKCSYLPGKNLTSVIAHLWLVAELKNNVQCHALKKLLAYINNDKARNKIITELKKEFKDQGEKLNLIIVSAAEMRTVLLGLCQCIGILCSIFPKELTYLIVCYSAAIRQEECEPVLTYLATALQPTTSLIQKLLSWFPRCSLALAPAPSLARDALFVKR